MKIQIKEITLNGIFRASIILKGLNGIWQIFGGLILFFISPELLTHLGTDLFEFLIIPGHHRILEYYINFSNNLKISTKVFAAVYLLFHGTLNLIMMISVWKHKLRVYPIITAVMLLMTFYQILRFSHTHSLFLMMITLLDFVIIGFLLREYDKKLSHKMSN